MSATVVTRIDLSGLERLTKEMEPRAEKVLDLAAQEVAAYAARNAPVDTGALKNSIHVEPEHERLTRIIADQVTYGIFQELGTYKMAAHPFMTPAVEAVRTRFTKMWEALFK
jgi:HK97 gp10 family phage protein